MIKSLWRLRLGYSNKEGKQTAQIQSNCTVRLKSFLFSCLVEMDLNI
jgi:hypothetical protein